MSGCVFFKRTSGWLSCGECQVGKHNGRQGDTSGDDGVSGFGDEQMDSLMKEYLRGRMDRGW